jgi:hypothetical protein
MPTEIILLERVEKTRPDGRCGKSEARVRP